MATWNIRNPDGDLLAVVEADHFVSGDLAAIFKKANTDVGLVWTQPGISIVQAENDRTNS